MGNVSPYRRYLQDLARSALAYRHSRFNGRDHWFERLGGDGEAIVFKREYRDKNILVPSTASLEQADEMIAAIPSKARHTHFGSMRSSQALTQSVFAALKVFNRAHLLAGIESDEGLPAFFERGAEVSLSLEHQVDHLGELEGRKTSLDVLVSGRVMIAVECKLAEEEFGKCSRTALREGKDSNFLRDHCNGNYEVQKPRTNPCSLTESGVKYWSYIPKIMRWEADKNLVPCPLAATYQIVRNLLAIADAPGEAIAANRHVLLVYDERNPSFQPGGKADSQWQQATTGLRFPNLLRRTSWQRIIRTLKEDPNLSGLIEELEEKYGLVAA